MLSLSNQTSSLAALLASTVVKFAARGLSNCGLLMSEVVRHDTLSMPGSSIPNVPAVEKRVSSARGPPTNGAPRANFIAPLLAGGNFENGKMGGLGRSGKLASGGGKGP